MPKNTTFNISFYCRESKKTKKGVSPIEMCIILNGNRIMLTLPRKEEPKFFSMAIKAKKSNPIKEFIEQSRNDVQDKIFELQQRGIPLNVENLKEFIQNGFCENYTLEMMFNEYLEILKSKVDSNKMQFYSYRAYVRACDSFYIHGANKNLQADNVSTAEIERFVTWLEGEYENATAIQIYKKITAIFKFGFDAGKISSNPTTLVKIQREKKDSVFLTEEELSKIEKTDFGNDSLNHYRDIFVFQSHTCLSYVDLKNLKREDILENEFGKYIQKKRQKTGITFTIRLDSTAEYILEKYNYDLNVKSTTKYNLYLKHLASIAGINKKITTHTARHTGATILLNNGTPKEVVQQVLGHSNLLQVETYAKMLDKTTLENLSHLEERMQARKDDALRQKQMQEDKVRLKLMLDKALKNYNPDDYPSEEEMDNIIDEVIANEPFDGSLERDFEEYNMQFGNNEDNS